ncbi:DUF3846 domain-containing protein [Cellulosimicrobium protaetiae]|uniref:DUF3846 domain-containing protein n=1 Tax=Cellulosimicrobium protaetiae TaxID=2587808 RepID=A0A6M5UJR7_9MICO|nr:DUF3846 domain-containing protein [Cellulosimicrobium protaetiae]QJW38696.1 DUF3846 domain-containing protein [Cellulosimicrobium protaetiae]
MSNTSFRAVTISAESEPAEVIWDASGGLLSHLQSAVGGFVDVVRLGPNLDMWVNDDGFALELPRNVAATGIAWHYGFRHQIYVGPAVFTGGVDEEGESLPLAPVSAAALVEMAGKVLQGIAL